MCEWAKSGPAMPISTQAAHSYEVFDPVGSMNDFSGRKGLLLKGKVKKNRAHR